MPTSPGKGSLLLLPAEIFLAVVEHLSATELLVLSLACRTARAVVQEEYVWRSLFERHFHPMLQAFFDGTAPLPQAGRTWRQHYFRFRVTWKQLAQERTGRLLIQVGKQQLSGRGPNEPVSLLTLWEEWRMPEPLTFGVYDVTDFADDHPASDLIIKNAAAMPDATVTFEMAGHSDLALRRLHRLAVPGLEVLPYDGALKALRRSSSSGVDESDARLCVAALGLLLAVILLRPLSCGAVCGVVPCDEHYQDLLREIPVLWPIVTMCAIVWCVLSRRPLQRKQALEAGRTASVGVRG